MLPLWRFNMKPTVRRWKDGLFVVGLNEGTKAILTLEELSRLAAMAEVEIREYLTIIEHQLEELQA